MRVFGIVIIAITLLVRPAHAIVLDDMITAFNRPQNEKIVAPKTTEELRQLFKDATLSKVPRIFVDKLPDDFEKNGDQKLYAQVMGALILRENEKALKDRVIIQMLIKKSENNEKWTELEKAYFGSLVEKYDVIAKKTIPTQLSNLLQKADEVPVGMAVAQSVYDTDWGKKNMDSPYGQTGWIDDKHYENLKFDSLIKATESYVKEMNATPNYFLWRVKRQDAARRGNQNHSYNYAIALRTYRPEDPVYTQDVRILLLKNPFLSKMDNLTFIQEEPVK